LQVDLNQVFPFQLDQFQKQAIAALDADRSVVVCAPTGSGKTVIGEYAIHRALAMGQRVFYTTPLKALSNQKFRDFGETFGEKQVGLITGDIIINAQATIVVMTTEIFRNMLYETPIGQVGTSLENVLTVVLDECHYISDRGRGTVWEESIIYCPSEIQIVGLSATIGNPEIFTAWINKTRQAAHEDHPNSKEHRCELVDSDHRPVPLEFLYSNKKGLYPLLDQGGEKMNTRLRSRTNAPQGKRKKRQREDCPSLFAIVRQLRQKDLLPAIYIIFSRRGCDRSVTQLNDITLVSPEEAKLLEATLLHFFLDNQGKLQEKLLNQCDDTPEFKALVLDFIAKNPFSTEKLVDYLQENLPLREQLWQYLAQQSKFARPEQVEPLLRGIAAHHAGILPAWKELVEKLFEMGLVKLVFATATLAAGINMPARTTVISALSKRTDEGHRMLTPSEFLQMAGRAGRRGMDKVGYVVTVETPFEGAKEASRLALSSAEPLRSWFTPSYGMVLNLLQKHSLEESKELLSRSFAEYQVQQQLSPEQEAIAELTTEIARLDIDLAAFDERQFERYSKLKERLKEEERLLGILREQAELENRKLLAPLLDQLPLGSILHLKGKNLRVKEAVPAVLVEQTEEQQFLCLGTDKRWYLIKETDVVALNEGLFPADQLAQIPLPIDQNLTLGKNGKIDAEAFPLVAAIADYLLPLTEAPEVEAQKQCFAAVQAKFAASPLSQQDKPGKLLKRHQRRKDLRKELNRRQTLYRQHANKRSYYWQDFLNLIEVLQEFRALDGYTPTVLGRTAATIRGENELWLALCLLSGQLDHLAPEHLAAAICAIISEPPRGDSWTDYSQPNAVLEVLGIRKKDQGHNPVSLWELRRQLYQVQKHCGVTMPVWLESKFIGLVEQWALGVEWTELCENTSLDEGDIVRMLRRTVDVLWQIPQIPEIKPVLMRTAKEAIAKMKRFPV